MLLNCSVWERLFRVSWRARRLNQSILKEISPEYSLEGLILGWSSNTLATWYEELSLWKRLWCWEKSKAGGEGDDRSCISWSLLKLMSIELVMPSNHLILCCPLLLLHSIFPSIRVFSNESVVHIRWPKYWSFSFSISPSNEHPGLISFRMDWFDLLTVQGTLKSLFQHHSSKHQFFGIQLSLWSSSHIHTWLLQKP